MKKQFGTASLKEAYNQGYIDGESSVQADIYNWLNERCGLPDDSKMRWTGYTRLLAEKAGVVEPREMMIQKGLNKGAWLGFAIWWAMFILGLVVGLVLG